MTTNFRTVIAATFLMLTAACSQAPDEPAAITAGDWSLDNAASELTYVSTKAGDIEEPNSFETLTGTVTPDGAASIEIDLASVSTGVDIRDERMREFLFVVADHPTATVTAQIDPAAFETMAVGGVTLQELDGTLSLKGIEAPFVADVTVTRTEEDKVLVVSSAPVVIDAGQFGLTDGLAELQELAGLPSISPEVPVSFSLTFTR